MSDKITYDEVYEIAAEVAEETVIKFLKNLVKLIPTAEEVVDTIKDAQYNELKRYRSEKATQSVESDPSAEFVKKPSQKPLIDLSMLSEGIEDDEFANIAHPGKGKLEESINDMDAALSQINLENSDLLGAAMQSPVDA